LTENRRYTLSPEFISAMEEAQANFRQLGTALTEHIASVIPLSLPQIKLFDQWPQIIIPQIKVPAFPDWLHDLIGATKGNLEAADRLCDQMLIPKGVSRDVLAQAVLRVLAHVEYDLPAYLENGTHGRDSDGRLKRLTPNEWLPYEVLEWLEVEAVRAARAMKDDDRCYSPKHNPVNNARRT
jgi:hypothetical protein